MKDHRFYPYLLVLAAITTCGCSPIRSKRIDAHEIYRAPDLVETGPQIQRGRPAKVLDTVGWVLGIPSKILLWDRRVDNHDIGSETELAIASYMHHNDLHSVRVRLNQYHPREDWSRLVRNKTVAAPWRYTFGTLSVLGETLIPGRLFGGDHYNPYTNTVHVYSDIPAIALHEGAHAKDFARRKWKGTYAAAYMLPVVPLYHESVASSDVVAYLEGQGDQAQLAEAHRILYPAYGTYVGSAGGYALPGYADPIYFGSVLAGHMWGRLEARRVLAEDENIVTDQSEGEVHRQLPTGTPELAPQVALVSGQQTTLGESQIKNRYLSEADGDAHAGIVTAAPLGQKLLGAKTSGANLSTFSAQEQ